MRPFIHEDFLLETDVARELYHQTAKRLPIIDFHCHLEPAAIAADRRFETLTELWLEGDHYKWRAMRAAGVPERLITGPASDWERFEAWASTVPHTLRNPLYHFTHLELTFPFGLHERLGPATARRLYEQANARLREPGFSAQGLLAQYRVAAVATTDDPADELTAHLEHQRTAARRTALLPTFRPDAALGIDEPVSFGAWLARLEATTAQSLTTYDDLLAALANRHDAFHAAGCRASDHGPERLDADPFTLTEVRAAFAAARAGHPVTGAAAAAYRSALRYELSLLDHHRGWVQQYHLGAARNLNRRRLAELGPNTGFDAMGDARLAPGLVAHLDRLDAEDRLTKTIVYNSNPRDTELFATLLGSFQGGGVPGKLQLGSAWWFLDQLDGMERQLEAISNHGLLRHFVGMLTDSRSLLSFSRHEYFRRLLCGLLGRDVARGRLPDDRALLAELVTAVCYENARDYFGFALPTRDD